MQNRLHSCLCGFFQHYVCDTSRQSHSISLNWSLYSKCTMMTVKSVIVHFLAVLLLDCVWNVMAHAQKPDFVFRRNGRVHLNRKGRQFSRLLAAEVCASAVVMLDTPCSEVVWRVLATHSIRQFPLHFHSRASPCAITFQLDCTLSVCNLGIPLALYTHTPPMLNSSSYYSSVCWHN